MTQAQLLSEFSLLPLVQQLEVIQAALRIVAQQAQAFDHRSNGHTKSKSLGDAARLLADDYRDDAELTSLTALDGEPFYA